MYNSKTIKLKRICAAVTALLLSAALLTGCSSTSKKTKVRVLIVPKFEIGEISGDFPGEAQLFYEHYCSGCDEAEIEHMPCGSNFFVNSESGVAVLVSGSGKTPAGLSMMAVLSSDQYDWSDTYMVSVG